MSHSTQNFEIHAGDSRDIVVTVTDSQGGAVDLTGAAIAWQLARSADAASPAVFKSLGTGISITDGPNGVFTVTLDSADTEGLTGLYYHEAEVTDTAGNRSTVLSGVATIIAVGSGSDSYMSLESADLYWSGRNDATWAGAELLTKEAALREATQYLDGRYDWIGDHPGGNQRLGWPRLGAFDHEGRLLTGIPEKVAEATAELARQALSECLAPTEARAGRTRREKVGPLEVEYLGGAPGGRSYPFVTLLLKGLIRGDGKTPTLVRA